jgi:hypothetical protein
MNFWQSLSVKNHWPIQGGKGCRAATIPKAKVEKKNTDFVDTIIPKIIRDLRFSLNQPLKSADD